MDPKEIVAATLGAPTGAQGGGGLPMTPEAQEGSQRLWWYLLVAGIVLLGADTLLSNRLSKKLIGGACTGVFFLGLRSSVSSGTTAD